MVQLLDYFSVATARWPQWGSPTSHGLG